MFIVPFVPTFSGISETIINSMSAMVETVVERATHMPVYAGSIPTCADHHKELILALSCSLYDVK